MSREREVTMSLLAEVWYLLLHHGTFERLYTVDRLLYLGVLVI